MNLYINHMPKNTQFYNDAFFDLNVDKIKFNKDSKKIMYDIEKAEKAGLRVKRIKLV